MLSKSKKKNQFEPDCKVKFHFIGLESYENNIRALFQRRVQGKRMR